MNEGMLDHWTLRYMNTFKYDRVSYYCAVKFCIIMELLKEEEKAEYGKFRGVFVNADGLE
jgi:hypothetical protein